jgi:hypothetical protein
MTSISQTLADLDVAAHIHFQADRFSEYDMNGARKAIARIAQCDGVSPAHLSADNLLDRYDQLRASVAPKSWACERGSIRALLKLPTISGDAPRRIWSGDASLADAIEIVTQQADFGTERARIVGAVKRFAGKIQERSGASVGQIRATELLVAPLLDGFTCADFALTPASWSGFKSRVRRAVRLVDIHARQILKLSMLTGEWQALASAAKSAECAGDLGKLWGLLAYCYRQGIEAAAVDDQTVAAFRNDLSDRGRLDGQEVVRNTVYAWERLQRKVPAWPATRLTRIYADGCNRDGLPFEKLPAELQTAWYAFVEEFGRDDDADAVSLDDLILDDEDIRLGAAPPVENSWSAARLTNVRTIVTYAANYLIDMGGCPKTLEELVTPEVATSVLERILARQVKRAKAAGRPLTNNSRRNNYLLHGATIFIALARDLELDDSMDALIKIRDRVDPRLVSVKKGKNGTVVRAFAEVQIGPRHKERLHQFNDDVKLYNWFVMPEILWERSEALVKAQRTPTLEDIGDMMVCVLHRIIRCAPMRRENLAELRCTGPGRNVILPTNKGGVGHMHVDWQEVKNNVNLDAELDVDAVAAIRRWLDVYRPALAKAVGSDDENHFLFPAAGAAHRAGSLLNAPFVDRNLKIGGFHLNLHCSRHLAAKIILDQDPRAMPLVQNLLSHKNMETTQRYYAEVNKIIAQRAFHQLLEAKLLSLKGGR